MAPKKFKLQLLHFRKLRGLTPEQLAEKSGLHPMAIRKIEDGQRIFPRLDTLRKLATGLGITLDELVG